MDTTSLRELKRRVSPKLLSIRGVSGVGVSGGRLTVYLEYDSPALRNRIAEAVQGLVKEGEIALEVAGKFVAAVPHD